MCGINGLLRLGESVPELDLVELRRTRDAMASRGPDGSTEWVSPDGLAALGHRRLSIIDLSAAAGQPMHTADGRFHLVTNGELYNYRQLRNELEAEGGQFRSSSDTEVLLHWLARHGVAGMHRLRGMYAFALWDAAERTLLLARDPYGIKPLYYSLANGVLRFASQVKALEAGGAVRGGVDPAGLCGFLLWGSVPEPWTIRDGVRALPPGHVLRVHDGRLDGPHPFQDFSDSEVGDRQLPVADALADSVAAHLVADVPLGIFLSAGLDSALLTALAVRALPRPPTTLTVAFDDFAGTPDDEAPFAREIAAALGTRHVERRIRREELLAMWPALSRAMDQPSIDGANTYLVCQAARDAGLTVAISGLGGDELFGSYPSFRDVPRWARWARRLDRLPGAAAAWPLLASRLAPRQPKLAGLLRWGTSLAGAYYLRRGLFLPEELPALVSPAVAERGLAELAPSFAAPSTGDGADPWLHVHQLESRLYMRNQLLRDTDWASMAHSIEVRVPLVDPWLRAAVSRADFEPARSQGKAALVRRVAPELPQAALTRRKSGFRVPLQHWLPVGSRQQGGAGSRRLALRLLDEWSLTPTELSATGSHPAAVASVVTA